MSVQADASPVEPKPKFRITPENARMLANRRWDAERAKANAPQPIAPQSAMPIAPADDFTKAALMRVRKQLEAIDKLMEDCADAKDWDMLSRSKERLFKVFAHLAGIPGAGQLRPVSPRKSRQSSSLPDPSPIDPTQ